MTLIHLDTPFAKELGFTSDRFEGWLGQKDGYIYISFIESLQPGQGNLSELFDNILKLGYGVKVPTPFARMKAIITKKGFTQTEEPFAPEMDVMDPCEVWVLECPNSSPTQTLATTVKNNG